MTTTVAERLGPYEEATRTALLSVDYGTAREEELARRMFAMARETDRRLGEYGPLPDSLRSFVAAWGNHALAVYDRVLVWRAFAGVEGGAGEKANVAAKASGG